MALLLLGNLSSFRADTSEPKKTPATATIPFDLVSGFLVVVHGQAGELKDLRFVLDTGTTRSVLDTKVADRLGLKRRVGKVLTFDHFIPIEWAELPRLEVGPLQTDGLQVMVVNVAQYSGLGKDVDGVIGLDLLSRTEKFAIDYEKHTVYFEFDDKPDNRPVPGSFLVPATVQGLPVFLVLDTGFQSILFYEDRLRKRIPKIRTEGDATPVALGRIRATRMRLPDVQIGGREEVESVLLMKGPDSHVMPGVDGYLGPISLHSRRIEFDFSTMMLRLK